MPVLQAALVKGGAREPAVSNPRPLVSWIPLQVGIVHTSGTSALLRLEESFLRHETLRLQRLWLASNAALGDAQHELEEMAVLV